MIEIDEGASSSVISGATHKCLMPTIVKLYKYSGEPLAIKGSMMAHVCYRVKEAKLSILGVKDHGPSLLGRARLAATSKARLAVD